MTNKPDPKDVFTKSQLASIYQVSFATMAKWLDKLPADIGRPFHGYYYTPGQIKGIYKKLDNPDFEKEDV